MPAARTHRHPSSDHATCKVGRCTYSGSRSHVIKHEVQEHIVRRFFCCACDKSLSSFESLRTHSNSQHFRNRRFVCEVCSTVYLDPARLAKCRKRHRGQFRCPEQGCAYHNARKNSVVRHLKTQHHRVADEDEIPFDQHLSSQDPPKMRRIGSSSASSVSALPGSVDSFFGVSLRGPTDDELFRQSEERRRQEMARTRREHAQWMGGEDALRAAVPDYPVWTPRDHPYGRAPSPEPESSPKQDGEQSESSSSPSTPELFVSSPDEVEGSHVPSTTTLRNWTAQASSAIATATASSGLLVPSGSLFVPALSPRTPTSTASWISGSNAYSDSLLSSFSSSTQSFPIPSPSMTIADAFNVPPLESSTLFSPHNHTASSPPLSSPHQPWHSPATPNHDHFLHTPLYDANFNSVYGGQYSDDASAASQESLFLTSPNPTFGFISSAIPHAHLAQEVKSESVGNDFLAEWIKGHSET